MARQSHETPFTKRLELHRSFLGTNRHKHGGTVLSATAIRLASTNFYIDDQKSTDHTAVTDTIPEPPSILLSDELVEAVQVVAGEPSFVSQGLGGWSPVGIVQHCMEYLHVGLDLPWWVTIMIGE